MASVKICDGRTVVYQYDTGVSIELCDCRDFTECHFAVNDGIIRRDVEDNICSVPDAALVNAGTLTVYAFSRNDDGGQTQHTFFIHVMARPKPADYIDPPDEADYIDLIAERAAKALPLFIVHVERVDGVLRADKTPAEISEALNARRVCMLRYGDAVLNFYGWRDGNPAFAGAPFKAFSTAHGAHYVHDFVVLDDGTVDATISEVNGLTAYPLVFEGGVEASYNGSKETRINISNVVNNALTVAKESGDFNGEPGTSVTITNITQSTEDDGYSVVTFSDGKQLRVKNGSKGSAGEGGAGGVVTVYCQPSDDMQSFTASMTVEEIRTAFEEHKAVQAIVLGMGIVAHAFMVTEDVVLFSAVASFAGESMAVTLNMMADGTNAMIVAPLGGMAVANITTEDGVTYTTNKTAAELYAAVSAGMPVYASLLNTYIPAQIISDGQAVFSTVIPDGTVTVTLDNTNVANVEIAPGGGGGDGGEVIVEVTRSGNVYTTSMMADAIYTAYAAGNRIVCRTDLPGATGILLYPTYISDFLVLFTGVFTDVLIASDGSMVVSVAIPNSNTAQVTINTLDKLPNPEPLTINGTSYDGSEAVNIDIAGGGGGEVELIERIECDGTFHAIDKTGLSLKEVWVCVETQGIGGVSSDYALTIRIDNGSGKIGGINTSKAFSSSGARYISVHAVSNGVAFFEYRTSAAADPATGNFIYRTIEKSSGGTYVDRVYAYAEGSNVMSAGSIVEIWGVRA